MAMTIRNITSSICRGPKHSSPVSVLVMSVRYIRGYRKQHEKQAVPIDVLHDFRTSELSANTQSPFCGEYTEEELQAARKFRSIHPEFMPTINRDLRDPVCEMLEREDMMKRRAKLDIPEFYVGSLMAVTLSDPYADSGESRFVGICIQRTESGLRHNFTLRNVVDEQGIEIMYELYNPTIKKIEVLKLEKRLDGELLYLRDAAAMYSTIPFDVEATPHPKGAPVPINTTKVRLNPRPWRERWERRVLKGVEGVDTLVNEKMLRQARSKQVAKPWEKYDLMKKYRESVPIEDQDEAYVHFVREQIKLEREQVAKLDKQINNKEEKYN